MSFGANSILDMGRQALFASQVQLQVTGENIANVNTDGYARRSVVIEEQNYINYRPGQLGTGVKAKEVVREFDEMVEMLYLEQNSLTKKWGNLFEQLQSVETLLNESNGTGISTAMSDYFNSWNDAAQRPDHYGSRQEVVNKAQTLVSTLTQIDNNLAQMQEDINEIVRDQVRDANILMEEIADLNKEIQVHHVEGSNNANALFDERGRKVRELGELLDIKTIDNGGGNFTVMTSAGQNLVDGQNAFALEFNSAVQTKDLRDSSTFNGEIYYEGSDDFEYTIEFLGSNGGSSTVSGPVSAAGTAAAFRVSLDGGTTWLTDDLGQERTFYAREYNDRIKVEDLTIWFGSSADSKTAPTGNFAAGDTFKISPREGLYWVENTSHKEEITPQLHFNGEENDKRITGGSLSALLTFRDNYTGKYREKLDELTKTMIWETNRRHSQGAGLQAFSLAESTYSVSGTTTPLGSDSSGLAFSDRLQSGATFFHVYNASTGLLMSSAAISFAGSGGAGFNPAIHTLADVESAIDSSFGGLIDASITNNKLVLTAQAGTTFAFGNDSAGLMSALGLNTFFKGDSANNVLVNEKITSDLDYLATGHVNGAGEMNAGDNTTALSMYAFREEDVTINSAVEGTVNTSVLEYYNSLVGQVGSDTSQAKFNSDFYTTLSKDLNERQQAVSGVNLDEEMSDLVKYQASFTAAAKLITTADQMLQTILSLKP